MPKKIHKLASFATLPLFATELALGQTLYNTPSHPGGKRAAHAFVGAGIVGLFAVNTVTFETSKVTRRNLAVASIGAGTAGYLIMLFGNH